MTTDGTYSHDGGKQAVRVRRFLLGLAAYGICIPLLAVAYLSLRYPLRLDLTSTGRHSTSALVTAITSWTRWNAR